MFDSVPLPKDAQLPESIREILAGLPPLNVFRMLANIPDAFPSYVGFAKAMYNGKFDRKLRQMALLRVAEKVPCKYLILQYGLVCKGLGVTDSEIKAIERETSVVSLDKEANFLCKVADELTLKSNLLDATFHEFYKRYGVEEGSELLLFLAAANMTGRFINATRIQVEKSNPLEGQSTFFPD